MATNRHGREIWFKPVLWNYWPCHWKGWCIQTAAIAGGLLAIGVLMLLARAAGHPEWDPFAFFAVLAAILVSLEIVARRHRPDQS